MLSLGLSDCAIWSFVAHTVAFKGEVASVLATSLPCFGLLLMDRVGDGTYAQR